jgi:hypothetical protein
MTCYCCGAPVELTSGLLAYCPDCDVFIRFSAVDGYLDVAEVYTLTCES